MGIPLYKNLFGNINLKRMLKRIHVVQHIKDDTIKLEYPDQRSAHIRISPYGIKDIINNALKAQKILADKYDVSADVWSATSYKRLRHDALNVSRWNMLHPAEPAKKSYVETVLEKEKGVFVAVSDFMKIVPEQIAPWVPGGLTALGTDGFGRSESRASLREFFEVDHRYVIVATLAALAREGKLERSVVQQAIEAHTINPEKPNPAIS